MYLLDSNVIVELAKERCLGPLAYGVTLDLAVYESTQAPVTFYVTTRYF
ncbi:MAG: hypothetical protein RXO24_03755 [Acidilobus sp.]